MSYWLSSCLISSSSWIYVCYYRPKNKETSSSFSTFPEHLFPLQPFASSWSVSCPWWVVLSYPFCSAVMLPVTIAADSPLPSCVQGLFAASVHHAFRTFKIYLLLIWFFIFLFFSYYILFPWPCSNLFLANLWHLLPTWMAASSSFSPPLNSVALNYNYFFLIYILLCGVPAFILVIWFQAYESMTLVTTLNTNSSWFTFLTLIKFCHIYCISYFLIAILSLLMWSKFKAPL